MKINENFLTLFYALGFLISLGLLFLQIYFIKTDKKNR